MQNTPRSNRTTHSGQSVSTQSNTKAKIQAAAMEALEQRQLLASGSWQPLVITCTAQDDVVLFKQQGDFLTVTNDGVANTYRWKSKMIPGSTPNSQVILPGINKIVVDGSYGNDSLLADNTVTVPMQIKGGAGNDLISGGMGDDEIYGGANVLQSVYESGYDIITGRGGNDTICSPKYGSASINANEGNDTVTGGTGNDYIDAGTGDDNVDAGMGQDTVHGRDGKDKIMGGWEPDTIYGEEGNDTINGGDGDDSILAGAGHDTVHGDDPNDANRSGLDTIYGGDGWDTLNGGPSDDKLYGEGGRDWFVHSAGRDYYYGGGDLDSLDYRSLGVGVRVKLTTSNIGSNGNGPSGDNDYIHNDIEAAWGGTGNDTLEGSNREDSLFGGYGNDWIRGYNGNDWLYGDVGFDTILGDAGMDNIYGGEHDDELHGGADSDYIYGEGGDDLIIAIGGGQADGCYGGSGSDSIWQDLLQTELSDATQAEKNAGMLHRVPFFFNGASKEIEGQKIADPSTDLNALGYASFGDKPLFGSQGINRHDVSQGRIGNCGLVAGLASIAAKHGERIEQAIVDLRDGTYAIRFKLLGQEMYLRLDNDLPVRQPNTKKLAYAGLGNGGSMWVALLEKAEAVVQGGYGNLWGIWPDVAYHHLGFNNTFEHWDGDTDELLDDMATYLNQGKMITAWTGSFDLDTTKPILPTHAYEVVAVNKSTGKVQVYNPWGTDTDGSYVQGSDDGLIWVSAQQFYDKFINSMVAS